MNAQEYIELVTQMLPRFQAHVVMKMFKNVTRDTEPRQPSLNGLMEKLAEEYTELVTATLEPGGDARAIQMECADVAVCAFLIFCLMHERLTQHPQPRYWRQFARDSGINKDA